MKGTFYKVYFFAAFLELFNFWLTLHDTTVLDLIVFHFSLLTAMVNSLLMAPRLPLTSLSSPYLNTYLGVFLNKLFLFCVYECMWLRLLPWCLTELEDENWNWRSWIDSSVGFCLFKWIFKCSLLAREIKKIKILSGFSAFAYLVAQIYLIHWLPECFSPDLQGCVSTAQFYYFLIVKYYLLGLFKNIITY